MGTLYTIGHSNVPLSFFVWLLEKFHIDYVLDVRSVPYSKYAPQFNREALEKGLPACHITYCFMGRYFGARQEDPSLYTSGGYLDFEKVRAGESFQIRLRSVVRGLEQGHTIALMCKEKDPFDCHRAIMVGRGFELAGIPVFHILHDGSIEIQDELNRRLMDYYFPDRREPDLFEKQPWTENEYLAEAYRRRNRNIGYHLPPVNNRY